MGGVLKDTGSRRVREHQEELRRVNKSVCKWLGGGEDTQRGMRRGGGMGIGRIIRVGNKLPGEGVGGVYKMQSQDYKSAR